MEFSTFDNNNVSPRVCTTKDEADGGNWFSDTESSSFCSSQSITASYKGTDAFPYKGGSFFFLEMEKSFGNNSTDDKTGC